MSLAPFRDEVAAAVAEITGLDAAVIAGHLERPKNPDHGDIALPCFRIAKTLEAKNPAKLGGEIATKAGDALCGDGKRFEAVKAAGPFVNFKIATGALARATLEGIDAGGEAYGGGDEGAGKTVVIDYSSPNIAKPFGVGHLRSTVIGAAVARVHRHLGHEVVGVNHLGDWGTQFGTLAIGIERYPDLRPSEDDPDDEAIRKLYGLYVLINNDKRLEDSYRKLDENPGHEAIQRDIECDLASRPDDAPPFERSSGTPIDVAAREWFRRLEAGDAAARAEWQELRQLSLREFDRIYQRLGVEFESTRGESDYNDLLSEAVSLAEASGLTRLSGSDPKDEGEAGALIADLRDDKLAIALLRKADGASLYLTRDIAGVAYRTRTYAPWRNLYVVGKPQELHFKQLKRVCQGIEAVGALKSESGDSVPGGWSDAIVHVSFGHYSGMSTRRGTLVFLEDLLDEAVTRARAASEESKKGPRLEGAELDAALEAIGLGAVIFNDLRQSRVKDIPFDWDRMLSFDGDSGPYLQFGYARLSGILAKWSEAEPKLGDIDPSLLAEPRTRTLLVALARFPDAVREAARSYEPSIISQYLLDLSAAVHAFVHEHQVIRAETPELGRARYALVAATRTVLRTGMGLLGIEALDRM